jgi:hypothetical protein
MFIVEAVENGVETYSEYDTRFEALEEVSKLRKEGASNISLSELRRIDYTDAEVDKMLEGVNV